MGHAHCKQGSRWRTIARILPVGFITLRTATYEPSKETLSAQKLGGFECNGLQVRSREVWEIVHKKNKKDTIVYYSIL